MRWIHLEPPGTICLKDALIQLLRETPGSRFLEVGVGAGGVSLFLVRRGYQGVGVDFSTVAIREASRKMKDFISSGRYRLVEGDFLADPLAEDGFDFALALFVMEHLPDDEEFLRRLMSKVRPGGSVIVAVPAGRHRWSIEDETVGHLRRYERADFLDLAARLGVGRPVIWSVGVPTANLLFRLGCLLVHRSREVGKRQLPQVEQTRLSGLQEIPFKTVFPPIFGLLLNRLVMYPAILAQRLFYESGWGVNLLVRIQRPRSGVSVTPKG